MNAFSIVNFLFDRVVSCDCFVLRFSMLKSINRKPNERCHKPTNSPTINQAAHSFNNGVFKTKPLCVYGTFIIILYCPHRVWPMTTWPLTTRNASFVYAMYFQWLNDPSNSLLACRKSDKRSSYLLLLYRLFKMQLKTIRSDWVFHLTWTMGENVHTALNLNSISNEMKDCRPVWWAETKQSHFNRTTQYSIMSWSSFFPRIDNSQLLWKNENYIPNWLEQCWPI